MSGELRIVGVILERRGQRGLPKIVACKRRERDDGASKLPGPFIRALEKAQRLRAHLGRLLLVGGDALQGLHRIFGQAGIGGGDRLERADLVRAIAAGLLEHQRAEVGEIDLRLIHQLHEREGIRTFRRVEFRTQGRLDLVRSFPLLRLVNRPARIRPRAPPDLGIDVSRVLAVEPAEGIDDAVPQFPLRVRQPREQAIDHRHVIHAVERAQHAGLHLFIRGIERTEADLRCLEGAEGADGEMGDDGVGVGDEGEDVRRYKWSTASDRHQSY